MYIHLYSFKGGCVNLDLKKEIFKLKEEKNALILAHLYQRDEIQEIADITGDSYFLSKKAMESDKDLIIFCGVKFMAESAKILSPNKRVLIPSNRTTCPMADMAVMYKLDELREKHKNAKNTVLNGLLKGHLFTE